jgi:hypothetical protein
VGKAPPPVEKSILTNVLLPTVTGNAQTARPLRRQVPLYLILRLEPHIRPPFRGQEYRSRGQATKDGFTERIRFFSVQSPNVGFIQSRYSPRYLGNSFFRHYVGRLDKSRSIYRATSKRKRSNGTIELQNSKSKIVPHEEKSNTSPPPEIQNTNLKTEDARRRYFDKGVPKLPTTAALRSRETRTCPAFE